MDNKNVSFQQPSTQSPSSPRNKLPLIFGGIILLLTISVGSYFLGKKSSSPASTSPSPTVTVDNIYASPTLTQKNIVAQDTTNWKEYTHTKVGYSLKYPNDSSWKPFINDAESTAAFMCEGICSGYTIDLFQITPVIFTSLDDYLKKDTLATNKTKIQLSGQEAIKGVQSGSEQAGGSSVVVFFVHKGKGYLITQRFQKLYNKTDLNQLPTATPDILSTFKFLDRNSQQAAISPSSIETITYNQKPDWQTYTNNEESLTIQYPPNYKLTPDNSSENRIIFLSCGKDPSGVERCFRGFNIAIYNDYDGSSRRVWYQNKLGYQFVNPYTEEATVSGVNSLIMMDGSDNQGGTSTVVLIPKGSKMYVIDFLGGWNPATGDKSGLPFVKEALSTFKLD